MMAGKRRLGLLLLLLLLVSGCFGGGRPPVTPIHDPQWSAWMQGGRRAYAEGDYRLAEKFFKQALSQARLRDHGAEIAPAAFNLAVTRLALEQPEDARAALAEAELETAPHTSLAADILLLKARLAWWQGQPQQASQWLADLRSWSDLDPARQALTHLLSGRIACEEGESDKARAELAAMTPLSSEMSPAIAAEYWALRGCLAMQSGALAQAAKAYDEESRQRRDAGQYRQQTDALERSADAFSALGDSRQAGRRYYRAARSLVARRQYDRARVLLQQALLQSRAAADADLVEQVINLQAEIRPGQTP